MAKHDEVRPAPVTVLIIILFIISIGYFAYSGYGIVNYMLSQTFSVETDYTMLNFISGIITFLASIIVFIGCIYAWRLKSPVSNLMIYGSFGFILKNILEIFDSVVKLVQLDTVTRYNIMSASAEIGKNIFHTGFWVFVAIFFSVQSFRDTLID